MIKSSWKLGGLAALTLSLLAGTGVAVAQNAKVSNATVAFLMPDQASTRYEEHDYPRLQGRDGKALPDLQGYLSER